MHYQIARALKVVLAPIRQCLYVLSRPCSKQNMIASCNFSVRNIKIESIMSLEIKLIRAPYGLFYTND